MRGPDGLLAGVRPSALLVDASAVYPDTSRDIADEARRRGASMLDAPVSGTTIHVEQGSLMISVGGDERDPYRATPYRGLLGNEIIHMGRNGMGLYRGPAYARSRATQGAGGGLLGGDPADGRASRHPDRRPRRSLTLETER